MQPLTVVLGTGGTIAGLGGDLGYRAGAVGIRQLVGAMSESVEVEQVAQIDSKDLDHATWRRLIDAVAHHLAREEVGAVVVTHGTDTLEESAYLLHRLLAPTKPVVLTGAMRPADSAQADGPQNLRDALAVAREPGARGVVVAFGGELHAAEGVRKSHPWRLQAFGSGDAGRLGVIEAGRLRRFREWPHGTASGIDALPADAARWPVVDIVVSHAGARGAMVDALVASGAEGLVVATTGNGTVHAGLEEALFRAQRAGVAIRRATRCLDGVILDDDPAPTLPSAGALTPVQARIALMIELAGRRAAAT